MRTLLVVISTCILAAASSVAVALAEEPEVSLKLSVAQSTVKAGAEVKLKIVLTNLTGHEIEIGRFLAYDGPELEYSFDLRDSQDRKVPLTRYGRALNGTPDKGDERNDCGDCAGFSEGVGPHETTYDEVVVSKIYDLGKPGKYTIQVSRFQGNGSHMIVKSNTITLTVTE